MKKFKDYKKEDAPANNTSGVANWNPPLGKSPRVMVRKKKNVPTQTERRTVIGQNGILMGKKSCLEPT